MTERAHNVITRMIYRVAQDYGRELAEVYNLERRGNASADARSLYARARIWKEGSYHAWLQLKTLIDTGKVSDPWTNNTLDKEPSHVH